MDIEGGEFEWLQSLNSSHMNNIAQMVIEFHNVTKAQLSLFENINKTHTLVNFHGNNCCDLQEKSILDIDIPKVFECLYINNKYLTLPLQLNKQTIPLPFDTANITDKPDIIISTPPFVNK